MSMPAVIFVRNLSNPQTPQLHLIDKRARLHAVDKLVLSTIATYLSLDPKRIAWPSVRTLAEDCWTSERGVQRSLARLEKAKLLHREIGCGTRRTSTYRITGFSPMPGDAAPPIAAAPPPKKPDAPPPPPASPEPATRVTPPTPPVSPTYKEESERTIERTLKGERTATNQAVCLPPVTPPKTLASQVVKELYLPKVLLPAVEEAISNEAKRQHIEPAAAAALISAWGAAAQAHGQPVDRFAFEDMRWRSHGIRKQSAHVEKCIHNAGVVAEMFGRGIVTNGNHIQERTRALLAG